jgi:hypothetical protein
LYGIWRHAHDQQSRVQSVGRAKGGGQSSKAKGRAAVQQVRALLLRMAPWLEEDDLLVKATSMAGVDLHLSPLAAKWFPFAIESKFVEKLNIWEALQQASDQAGGKPPIVFFKRARTEMYVALRATDLLKLLPWPSVQPPLAPPDPPATVRTPSTSPEPTPSSS